MPKSRSQFDLLEATIASDPAWDGHYTWFGLDDLHLENTFVWNDGLPVTWSYWASGQPNNWNGQDCGLLLGVPGTSLMEWHDGECDDAINYVCEEGRWIATIISLDSAEPERLKGRGAVFRRALSNKKGTTQKGTFID